MDAAAFCTAITCCGYNQALRDHIIAQGFTTTAKFQAFPVSEVNNMIKTLTKSPPAGVSLPYLANLRLQGFRHCLEYRHVCGENLDTGVWANAIVTKWTQRAMDLANATTADNRDDPKAPEPLKLFTDWENHNKLWLAYLAMHHNPTTGVPLTYVLRETVAVNAEALAANYKTIEDDLIMTTRHKGNQFLLDCKWVFDLYRPIIIDGPAWTFVKPTQQQQKNGRDAYFTVK